MVSRTMFDDDDTAPDDSAEEISALCHQLRMCAMQLRQTTQAVKSNRRTPMARQALIARAILARYRSLLIRRKYGHFVSIQ